jgi:hypothetical protein
MPGAVSVTYVANVLRDCLVRFATHVAYPSRAVAIRARAGVRVRWQIDLNTVAGADLTPIQYNRHDSGFANDCSLDVTIQCRGQAA